MRVMSVGIGAVALRVCANHSDRTSPVTSGFCSFSGSLIEWIIHTHQYDELRPYSFAAARATLLTRATLASTEAISRGFWGVGARGDGGDPTATSRSSAADP
jgi:hypothetical protein